ncbi:Hypothetical protein PHPALM_9925 [Phytophthora palmivora]|uniref:Uncharacterized protein n=1 Tax=Phytophthora palmivora TaxID=4796 RepID=A0A2P4Y611_9STRA|nr:Hypothetical protein PHPALM_9925 [Phytophthora palmivora]
MCHFRCHSCLLRGEWARNLELPDLFCVELEYEGYTYCHALVMVMWGVQLEAVPHFLDPALGCNVFHPTRSGFGRNRADTV